MHGEAANVVGMVQVEALPVIYRLIRDARSACRIDDLVREGSSDTFKQRDKCCPSYGGRASTKPGPPTPELDHEHL